jgi:hypothetical protein
MWHPFSEWSMVRLFSLFGIAVFALAAVAVASTPRIAAEEPSGDTGTPEKAKSRVPAPTSVAASSFHARFSLN